MQAFYALASIFVALLAWLLTRPFEAQQVKSRLTVEGLAAGFFETGATQERAVDGVEQLYSEHVRSKEEGEAPRTNKVGIKQTGAGGWVWVASGRVQKTRANDGDGFGAVMGEVN